jgi:hypothetical protein
VELSHEESCLRLSETFIVENYYLELISQFGSMPDLTGAGKNQEIIFVHRLYCLAIAVGFLSLAHLFFPRHSTYGATVLARIRHARWPIIIAILATWSALIMALLIQTLH